MERIIATERDRARLTGFISGLDLSKGPMRVTITKKKTARSAAQNKLLWVWNNLIQEHMREHFGQIASAEDWHEILVERLCPCQVIEVVLPDSSAIYRAGRARTSKMSVDEMGAYMNLLDAYCASELSLLLPNPSDYELAVYGERKRP